MKKEILAEIPYSFNWTWGVSIDTIRKDLNTVEKLGATDIQIETEESYGNICISITATCKRLETDEEYGYRLKREEENKKRIEELELQHLQKLKAKYE